MFIVYIIYSEKLRRFYVGTTDNFIRRISEHNSTTYKDAFTSRGLPWEEFFVISGLSSEQAIKMENHIKKMKSTEYLMNLKNYPEMVVKLKEKFK